MKKQTKFRKEILGFLLFSSFIGIVFGAYSKELIPQQVGDNKGSSNLEISFTGVGDGYEGYYANDNLNSAIIGNKFLGYYYDNVFGYFKLDWSSEEDENVQIIDSTNLCSSGYGYKIGGKAYSEISGFIDFNYNEDTFVYFCEDDGKLHGTAFGKYIGFQDFEGIELKVISDVDDLTDIKERDDIFVNDQSNIIGGDNDKGGKNIGGDVNYLDDTKESIFYIVK